MSPKPKQFSKESLVIQRAQKAVLARDYQAAIRLYVRILKADPNNKDVLTKLAGVYILAGDDANALKIFTKILKSDPLNFKALNHLSGIYRRMGKLDESLDVINKLKNSGLNADEVEFNAGYTYKLMGKYDEALSSFYNALEKNPTDVLAYNHIGSIEDLRGNNDKAIAAFSRGLQIDPNNPVLHYNTAMHFASQNEPDMAAQHFESALKANAGWGDALNQYSDLLIHCGTEDRAETLLLKNIKLNPENTTAYNKLGQLYSRQKKYDDAEKMYLKVLTFDSENMAALSGLGTVYDKQKKYFNAAAMLERLGKLQADDSATALRYAKILIELNRLQDAAVLLKKLYISEPNDIPLLNILGQYFIRSRDFKKAYVCLKRISRIDPDECDFLKDNATQFMYIKAFENAEKLLQTYLKKRPDDSEAWTSLAKCYEAMRQYKKSLAALRHCLELDQNNFNAIELLGNLSRSLSNDPESTDIITDLLNKTISAEGNLDTLLHSMEARENILNHITKIDLEDENESMSAEDEINEEIRQQTEIELFDDDEDEFMQLDFLAPDDNLADEYNPLELITQEDDKPEQAYSDETFNFSDLLAPDMPVEYDRSRDGDLLDNPFDFPYSQKYDPSEEETVIDVDGTGFEPEDFEEQAEKETEDLFALSQEPATELAPHHEKNMQNESGRQREPYEPRRPFPEQEAADTPPPIFIPEPIEDEPEPVTAEPDPLFNEDLGEDDFDNIDEPLEEVPENLTESSAEEKAPQEPEADVGIPAEPQSDSEKDTDIPPDTPKYADEYPNIPLEADNIAEEEEIEEDPVEEEAEEEDSPEEALSLDEELMKQMREVLAHVFEKPPIKEFSRTFEMFNSLRGLCSYLPAVKKDEFFSDLNRVKLDYVIDRLEGKPGLLAAAQALHARGLIKPF